jgi:hypothetical protein
MMLARNPDIDGALRSIRRLENRFKTHHNLPCTFLNDVSFYERVCSRVCLLTKAPFIFASILRNHWVQAPWVDEYKAEEGRRKTFEEGVIYADSVSFRNMCRYNSGVRRPRFVLRALTPIGRSVLLVTPAHSKTSLLLACRVRGCSSHPFLPLTYVR